MATATVPAVTAPVVAHAAPNAPVAAIAPGSDSRYSTYETVNTANMSCTSPETKNVPNTQGQTYMQVPLSYNYGTPEAPRMDEFLLEGPELTCEGGIQAKPEGTAPTKPGETQRMSYTMVTRLPLEEKNTHNFVTAMNSVYGVCAYIIHGFKGQLKLFEFNKDLPSATGFKNPVSYARDKVTGDLIKGKAPSMWLKLFKRGYGVLEEKTLFTDLKGKPIPWEILSGVDLKFIPLLHVEKIYVGGGKASLQIKLKSAIITNIRPRNTVSRQMQTIRNLADANPDQVETLEQQIAKLMMDRAPKAVSVAAGVVPATTTVPVQPAAGGFGGFAPLPVIPPLGPAITNITGAPTQPPVDQAAALLNVVGNAPTHQAPVVRYS